MRARFQTEAVIRARKFNRQNLKELPSIIKWRAYKEGVLFAVRLSLCATKIAGFSFSFEFLHVKN